MLQKLIHTASKFFLDFFFPQKCIGCGLKDNLPTSGLCQECLERIDYPTISKSGNIFAATDYNDQIAKKAIWLLKYRKIKQLAEPLAELVYQRLIKNYEARLPNPVIIPIPLSQNRLRERGFNQSELLARHLASLSGFEMINNVLYKTRETVSQVSIKDRRKRLDNLKDSFGVKNPEMIKSKNIILIDDVTTTGVTIKEARKILKEAGAKKIIALVVARG